MKHWARKAIVIGSAGAIFTGGFLFGMRIDAVPREDSGQGERGVLTALTPSGLPAGAEKVLETTASDFPSLWKRYSEMENSEARLQLLAARWIDVDLGSAKTFFAALARPSQSAFLEQYALADPAAALEFAKALPEDRRTSAVDSVLRALAAHQPALVAAELIQTPDKMRYMRDAIAAIIGSDPSLAPQILAANQRRRDLPRLVALWAAVDPQAALDWASELESLEDRDETKRRIIDQMAAADPAAAAAAIEQLDFNDPHSRKRFLEGIAKKIADAHDGGAATEWILEHCPEGSQRDILFGMMSDSSRTALQMLDAVPAGKMRDNLSSQIWMNWSDPHVAPALAWVDANLSGSQQTNAYGTIASGLASRNFDAALRALDALPKGAARDSYERELFIGHAQRGGRQAAQEALDMILGRYDEKHAHQILVAAFPQVSSINPEAAELFLDALPIAYRNQHASYQMASIWSKKDIGEAMAWTATLPEGEARDDALYGLSGQLPDNEATAAWFNELPASEGRDKVAAELLSKSLRSRPAEAFVWAQSFSSERKRGQQLNKVLSFWSKDDPAEASAAIASAAISDREKRALTVRLENRLRSSNR